MNPVDSSGSMSKDFDAFEFDFGAELRFKDVEE